MPQINLTPAQRKDKRADAHHLDPVVMIGGDGLTPAVVKETDAALKAHGLIKVRVLGDDRAAREAMFAQLCDELNAAPIQHIGKLLVLWRPLSEKVATEREDARHVAFHVAVRSLAVECPFLQIDRKRDVAHAARRQRHRRLRPEGEPVARARRRREAGRLVAGLRVPATIVLSSLTMLLGVVLLVETAVVGGLLGFLIGALFVLAGGLRLALVLRSR